MVTLRKKLEVGPDAPRFIQTHAGIGYRMLKVERLYFFWRSKNDN